MREVRLLAVAGAVLTLVACRSDSVAPGLITQVAVDGEVSATRVPGGIRLTNGLREPIAWFAFNPFLLAQWATCADPGPECLRLAAGAVVTIADADVAGYAPGLREVMVHIYRVVPDGQGGFEVEAIRDVTVPM